MSMEAWGGPAGTNDPPLGAVSGNMAPNPQGKRPKFEVEPPESVWQEIESHNTSLNDLLEQAKLTLLDMQGEESGATRWFIERGYSDEYAAWLVQEAKARENQAM